MEKKKQILVQEGIFTVPSSPSEKPRLIGSKCRRCGEVVFPTRTICPNCCTEAMEQVLLGPRGKLYSFTNVNHPGPGGYKGPVPYGVGKVELSEGTRVLAHLTEHDPSKVKPGMDMELVVEKMFDDDEGNEVIGFKFRPL